MKIRNDYKDWITQEHRASSKEIDIGVGWHLHAGDKVHWRLTWIEKTGELYAKKLDPWDSNDFIVITIVESEEKVRKALKEITGKEYPDYYFSCYIKDIYSYFNEDKP